MATHTLPSKTTTDIQVRTLVRSQAPDHERSDCREVTGSTKRWRAIFLVIGALTSASARALTLTGAQVAQYAYDAGFRDLGNDRGLVTAIAIARAESSFKTDAVGYNRNAAGKVLSIDRGLWQINSYWHSEVTETCAFDPACAAAKVFNISDGGTDWHEWETYSSGAYSNYLSEARTAATAFLRAGAAAARVTTPVNGSTLNSASVTFYWSTGQGVTEYRLYVGTAQGKNDLYERSAGNSLRLTVSNLPTDGRTLYVRLWSLINDKWQFTDTTYRAFTSAAPKGSPARMTNPAEGTRFTSSTVTFYWTTGQGVAEYFLYVGNSQGANDIYGGSAGTKLSWSVRNLPTDGRRIYVRLWSRITGDWRYNDYAYQALRR